MPDLTIEAFYQCESVEQYVREVPSDSDPDVKYVVTYGRIFTEGGEPEVGWECTCPHFEMRKAECKHIRRAMKTYCGWMQFIDGSGPAYGGDGAILCPRCGGPVEARNWAI